MSGWITFDHQDTPSREGELGGSGQAVGTRAHDDRIEIGHGAIVAALRC